MNLESDSPKITPNYSNLCLNVQTSPCSISKSDRRISLIPRLPLGFPLEFFLLFILHFLCCCWCEFFSC
ncbi:hypothetical protein ES319_D12G057600v1 [Gossypium barbadense]|uniref:Uncharacterized protein n=3 Tax=Gossypium TaxID=3633 RepID=A0A5J5NUC8_GOSBA|nr:hypothetical protein ES319_D12G057600v1 [Gossypium barbadense]TYG40023.1 hypothetical protein ES288_D12G060000v1 [Gossypium darwinii]TYH37727.1 hypothetical protein ES332_D12G060100v1 [Gossypium tomentosum]